jgi:hypothetical protein
MSFDVVLRAEFNGRAHVERVSVVRAFDFVPLERNIKLEGRISKCKYWVWGGGASYSVEL